MYLIWPGIWGSCMWCSFKLFLGKISVFMYNTLGSFWRSGIWNFAVVFSVHLSTLSFLPFVVDPLSFHMDGQVFGWT